MAINNIVSNISLSTQMQLSNGQLDTRLGSNQGIEGSASGLILSPLYEQYRKTYIIDTSFKNLLASPVELVPAPGSGKFISLDRAYIYLAFGGAAYTGGSNLAIQYGNGAYNSDLLAIFPYNSTDITSVITDMIYRSPKNINNLTTIPTNQGLYLVVNGTDFATGDGDFYVHVWYKVYTP